MCMHCTYELSLYACGDVRCVCVCIVVERLLWIFTVFVLCLLLLLLQLLVYLLWLLFDGIVPFQIQVNILMENFSTTYFILYIFIIQQCIHYIIIIIRSAASASVSAAMLLQLLLVVPIDQCFPFHLASLNTSACVVVVSVVVQCSFDKLPFFLYPF